MKRTVLVIAALLLGGSYVASSKPGLAHAPSLSGVGYGFGLVERVGWGDNGQGGGYGGTPQNQSGGSQGGGYGGQPQNQGGGYQQDNKGGNQGGTYDNNNQGTYNNDNYPKKKKRKNQGPYNNGGVYQGQGGQGGYGGNNNQGGGNNQGGQQGGGQQGGGQGGGINKSQQGGGEQGGGQGGNTQGGGNRIDCLSACQSDCTARDAAGKAKFSQCMDSCTPSCQ